MRACLGIQPGGRDDPRRFKVSPRGGLSDAAQATTGVDASRR